MKKACCVSMALAGLIAFVSTGHADTVVSSSSASSADDDPNVRYDPDGVPLSVTEKKSARATPEEIAADRKVRAQAELDKDWLLRAYEKQLQTHSTTSTSVDKNANPYQEVTANKDLAKLAGLTDYQADPTATTTDEPLFRTKDGAGDHVASQLRPGSASSAPLLKNAPFGSSFLTPLVSPISAPDAAGIKNFYASLPDAAVAPFNGSTPAPQLKPRTSIIPDPTDNDIETPGMIAAKSDPLSDVNTADPSLDMLPGESLEHAKAHQDNSESLLQLPIAMDADQLHRVQANYLNPPIAKAANPNQPTITISTKPTTPPLENYHEVVPITQMPIIAPTRSPIANPYDILNR
jgi:hypothetical protein